MNLMDDTLADESGIPFLSSADDIPVHSTPIKGTKIPLPSTKDVMKQLLSKPGRYEDYTDSESLQSIRHSDLHPRVKGQQSAQKIQGQNGRVAEEENFVRKSHEYQSDWKHPDRNVQDLSDIDNLRQKSRNSVDRTFKPERSRSPHEGQRRSVSEEADVFKRPKDVPGRYIQSDEDGKRSLPGRSENCDKMLEQGHRSHGQSAYSSERALSKNMNSNAFSSYESRSKYLTEGQKGQQSPEVTNSRPEANDREYKYALKDKTVNDNADIGQSSRQDSMKVEKTKLSGEIREPGSERKRFSMSSPRHGSSNFSASYNRTLSSSKQNTSLSELENTTLHKQRQEIQLLMGELKDRDRELSDMMTSHQQQLVAWQQDRDRLASVERKCIQYEEELRMKASQLRNAVSNLKTMKSTESENKRDLEKFRSTFDRLSQENSQYKEEITQLQGLNESLQENVNNLSSKVGKLEAREEELTTSLRLKEKDISSATGHMRELSERLQQLDLRCKECQDRERDASKEKEEWKQKYENTKDEFNTLAAEMDHRRKEAVRLAEENKSARQQLALIQKEANMMERCKDELIDSMRVKQERTDTQLRNLRELYDRQVREVASLQLQLDNSKELIYRQQNSIDDQQLSSSYQGRLSQASEYSLERSSASQRQPGRNKSSPSHSSKYREPDMTGSHQHTQSSGYQSQLYENQTGNHQVPNTLENNYINLTGSKHSSRLYQGNSSERNTQTAKTENQSVSRHSDHPKSIKDIDNRVKNTNTEPNIDSDIKKGISESEIPDTRDASRELVIRNFQTTPKDPEASAKAPYTPPKAQTKLVFDSPQRQDGYVIHETTIDIYTEEINPGSQKPPPRCDLSENAFKAIERAENMLTKHSDTQKDLVKTDTETDKSETNTRNDNGAKSGIEENIDDRFQGVKLNENFVEGGREAHYNAEFEKKYTFENKLCSFLEDLDDIDDSIWDEKPLATKNANVSTIESSPASKLRKLLIESQQMIQSLEKSSESPRQVKVRDNTEQTGVSASTEENVQQKS